MKAYEHRTWAVSTQTEAAVFMSTNGSMWYEAREKQVLLERDCL